MITVVLLQVVLPCAIIGWLWLAPLPSRAGLLLQILAVAVVLLAIGAVGLWLTLPIWLLIVYAFLAAGGVFKALRRDRGDILPRRNGERIGAIILLAVSAVAGTALAGAAGGKKPPADDAIDLASPLRGSNYFVANGGSSVLVNSHNRTLDQTNPRFRAFYGQSQGVDIVQLNALGRTPDGLRPSDPRGYAIFGDAVYAPCSGRVLVAREDRPDMPVPITDRSFLPGNHVILGCAPDLHVVLAHFRHGGVAVKSGDTVRTGDLLGEVGNSGNSDEPHLHIHAQRPGTPAQPLSGEPLPIRIGGRYLLRNNLIPAARKE